MEIKIYDLFDKKAAGIKNNNFSFNNSRIIILNKLYHRLIDYNFKTKNDTQFKIKFADNFGFALNNAFFYAEPVLLNNKIYTSIFAVCVEDLEKFENIKANVKLLPFVFLLKNKIIPANENGIFFIVYTHTIYCLYIKNSAILYYLDDKINENYLIQDFVNGCLNDIKSIFNDENNSEIKVFTDSNNFDGVDTKNIFEYSFDINRIDKKINGSKIVLKNINNKYVLNSLLIFIICLTVLLSGLNKYYSEKYLDFIDKQNKELQSEKVKTNKIEAFIESRKIEEIKDIIENKNQSEQVIKFLKNIGVEIKTKKINITKIIISQNVKEAAQTVKAYSSMFEEEEVNTVNAQANINAFLIKGYTSNESRYLEFINKINLVKQIFNVNYNINKTENNYNFEIQGKIYVN